MLSKAVELVESGLNTNMTTATLGMGVGIYLGMTDYFSIRANGNQNERLNRFMSVSVPITYGFLLGAVPTLGVPIVVSYLVST